MDPRDWVFVLASLALAWVHGIVLGRYWASLRILCPRCGIIVRDSWAFGHHIAGCTARTPDPG